MYNIGTGAIHCKYQKFPVRPDEKYQHTPEKRMDTTIIILDGTDTLGI